MCIRNEPNERKQKKKSKNTSLEFIGLHRRMLNVNGKTLKWYSCDIIHLQFHIWFFISITVCPLFWYVSTHN